MYSTEVLYLRPLQSCLYTLKLWCLLFRSEFCFIDWGFGNLNGSLEQVQVELFEKQVCGGSKLSLYQYSMVLFWCSNNEGILAISSRKLLL